VDLRNNQAAVFLKRFSLILIVLGQSMQNYAQDKPSVSTGNLTFYLDQASFVGNEGKTYVELYLLFYADQLIDFSSAELQKSEIKISSIVKDSDGNQISKSDWVTEVKLEKDEERSFGKVIYDQWSEEIPPGSYEVIVEASDLKSVTKGKLRKNIIVPKIENNTWSSSEIEFVAYADNTTKENHFKKGNLNIIPNPSRRYGILIPKLYFHYEIYGIAQNEQDLIVDYSIVDGADNKIKELKNVTIKKPGASASVLHGMDVSSLKSGVYELVGLIKDSELNSAIKISRQFEIIQADFFQSSLAVTKEQDDMFETILSYLGTSQQMDFYKSLNATGKTEYMIQYWKNLDLDPNTIENKYLETIQKKFAYASKNFGWGRNLGWKTERARVLIKYGMPDEIDQHYSEPDSKPYEIWIYGFDKKYIFVFGDLQGNGKFILLHSDKQGEVYNNTWAEYLKKI